MKFLLINSVDGFTVEFIFFNSTVFIGEEERTTRRVSYLKATWGDRMHIESDLDLSDTEVAPHVLRR